MAKGTPARKAALEILRRVRAGQKFSNAHSEAVENLADPDKRLAHEIAAGVLRGRTELDRRLRPLVSGGWRRTSPDLKDLLRIGAYQLVELDRVPTYAAVQATVEVAKKNCGRGGAGMVNAVLRRVAECRQEVSNHPKTDEPTELADAYSHPAWLVERWIENYGKAQTTALLKHNNQRPALIIQPIQWSEERLAAELAASEVNWTPAPSGMGFVVERVKVSDIPGYLEGAFIVQDPAQARLLQHVAIPQGKLVWDACSSPGGKAAVLSKRGPLVASDSAKDRMARLSDTLDRTGCSVPLFVGDARYPPVAPKRTDVTLIDAPCSATGTFQRHPDGRWRLTEQKLGETVRIQSELLDGASSTVRPGGLLVYLTCSLEPEENQIQVDRFLDRNDNFCRDGDDLFLFPPDFGSDGGYAARLRRSS